MRHSDIIKCRLFTLAWGTFWTALIWTFWWVSGWGSAIMALLLFLGEWLDLTVSFRNKAGSTLFQFLRRAWIISFLIFSKYAVRTFPLIRRHWMIISRFFILITKRLKHLSQLLNILERSCKWHLSIVTVLSDWEVQVHRHVWEIFRLADWAFGTIDYIRC